MRKLRGTFFWEGNRCLRRRMKRTTKQYIIVAAICIIALGGAAVFTAIMVTGQIRDKYAAELEDAYKEMAANKKSVFVAKEDIAPGDYITETNVILQTDYAPLPQETYISSKDIGKVALINISAGTQLLSTMVSEKAINSELREVEYSAINISSNIADNDTIDIRIMYPNGETYVVLSKKVIRGYAPDTPICHLWLAEEELLRMSAAIVDAGLYSGSKLFVTKYIEPNIQEASIINYTPSLSILALLERDPNVLERASQELNKDVRKALENRLANSLNMDVSSIAWDINPHVQTQPVTDSIPDPSAAPSNIMINIVEPDDTKFDGELGLAGPSNDFFYYAEEEKAMEEDVEYGE